MPESTARTVIIYSIIGLILGGLTIGGVRLLKVRNSSYAGITQVASTPVSANSSQTPATTQQPKPTPKKTAPSTSSQTTPTAAVASPKTTSAPVAQPTPVAAVTVPQGALPATSAFSPESALPTIVLVMLAGFFGSQLLRARISYRRYLS